MLETNLKQPGFTYSACGQFTRSKSLCKPEIKYLFTKMNSIRLDTAYGKSEDLVKRTQSNKILRDKESKIANDRKFDGYQRGLASMVYKLFENNQVELVLLMNQSFNWQMNFINQLFKKLKNRKVYSSFRHNIWVVDLAGIQSLSKYNERIKYSLCTIDIFSKYAWVITLKDKRGIRIVNAFQKIILQGKKLNKI